MTFSSAEAPTVLPRMDGGMHRVHTEGRKEQELGGNNQIGKRQESVREPALLKQVLGELIWIKWWG